MAERSNLPRRRRDPAECLSNRLLLMTLTMMFLPTNTA
jgi:hypothetical protein